MFNSISIFLKISNKLVKLPEQLLCQQPAERSSFSPCFSHWPPPSACLELEPLLFDQRSDTRHLMMMMMMMMMMILGTWRLLQRARSSLIVRTLLARLRDIGVQRDPVFTRPAHLATLLPGTHLGLWAETALRVPRGAANRLLYRAWRREVQLPAVAPVQVGR